MATTLLPPDFKEFLQLLNTHHVKYLLIGGYAVGYYGYPRATADLDIWIEKKPANADKIVRVLQDFGFGAKNLTPDLFLEEKKIIRMGVPPVQIEILTTISGVSFEECYAARQVDELDGIDVSLISLDHLKVNKKASGRHKDLNDLENLPST